MYTKIIKKIWENKKNMLPYHWLKKRIEIKKEYKLKRRDKMELKEIKDSLTKSKQQLEELWRSLWHWFDKRESKKVRISNKSSWFLEW